jgi:hypothetical protein
VGIGTSSPGAKLDIQGGNIVVGTTTAGNSTASMTFGKVAAGGGTISNRISLATYGGAYGAYIEAYADLSASTATYLAFGTQAGGGGTPTERARIDSSGNLLVGATVADAGSRLRVVGASSTSADYALVVDRAGGADIFGCRNDGYVVVSSLSGSGNRAVYSDASGGLTNSSSDRNLKEDDREISQGLPEVLAMRPVNFKWIDEDRFGKQRELGFIAQEMQELVPEVIGENSDGSLSLDYPKLVPVLVKAIQEQQAIITALTARVEALEGTQP